MINRFGYRMIDGLALPLFAFPLASTILGFALLSRRSWPRTALTATGVAALAWSGWWLRDSPLLCIFPAAYIVLTCGLLWTPAGSRWYRWKPGNAAF
jgi:hypothetical protein